MMNPGALEAVGTQMFASGQQYVNQNVRAASVPMDYLIMMMIYRLANGLNGKH
jgi:hypothetical protein